MSECDCDSVALISYLFGLVSMVFFVLWYGQRSARVSDREEKRNGDA